MKSKAQLDNFVLQFDLSFLRSTIDQEPLCIFNLSSNYSWRQPIPRRILTKEEMISKEHLLLFYVLLTILYVSLLFHDSLNFNLCKKGYL